MEWGGISFPAESSGAKRLHNAVLRGNDAGRRGFEVYCFPVYAQERGRLLLDRDQAKALEPANAVRCAPVVVKACESGPQHVVATYINSDFTGRWDRNRTCTLRYWRPHPVCRGVSDAIATCRSAPLALSPPVAACRRVSAVTGADTGAAVVTWYTDRSSGTLSSW